MFIIFGTSSVKIHSLSDDTIPDQSFWTWFLYFFFYKEVEGICFFINYLLLKVSNALLKSLLGLLIFLKFLKEKVSLRSEAGLIQI